MKTKPKAKPKPVPKKASKRVSIFKDKTPVPQPTVVVVPELTPAERLAAELRDKTRQFDGRWFLHPGTVADFLADYPVAQ